MGAAAVSLTQLTPKATIWDEMMQNYGQTRLKVTQGNHFRSQSKARMQLAISE